MFELTQEDKGKFLDDFCSQRLTYGAIEGRRDFRKGICHLYKTLHPEEIVPTHGASGANHYIFYTWVNHLSAVLFYSKILRCRCAVYTLKSRKWISAGLGRAFPFGNAGNKDDLYQQSQQFDRCIDAYEDFKRNSKNCAKCGCMGSLDEVYRHLTQEDVWSESIVDLYEKGISVSSMFKVFSLAELRLGWIAAHDQEDLQVCFSHRDYDLIICGMFDESVAALALRHADKILDRNKELVRRNLQVLDDWVRNEDHVYYQKPQAGTTRLFTMTWIFLLTSSVCRCIIRRVLL